MDRQAESTLEVLASQAGGENTAKDQESLSLSSVPSEGWSDAALALALARQDIPVRYQSYKELHHNA